MAYVGCRYFIQSWAEGARLRQLRRLALPLRIQIQLSLFLQFFQIWNLVPQYNVFVDVSIIFAGTASLFHLAIQVLQLALEVPLYLS